MKHWPAHQARDREAEAAAPGGEAQADGGATDFPYGPRLHK